MNSFDKWMNRTQHFSSLQVLKFEITQTIMGNWRKKRGVGDFGIMWRKLANKLAQAQERKVNVGNVDTVL